MHDADLLLPEWYSYVEMLTGEILLTICPLCIISPHSPLFLHRAIHHTIVCYPVSLSKIDQEWYRFLPLNLLPFDNSRHLCCRLQRWTLKSPKYLFTQMHSSRNINQFNTNLISNVSSKTDIVRCTSRGFSWFRFGNVVYDNIKSLGFSLFVFLNNYLWSWNSSNISIRFMSSCKDRITELLLDKVAVILELFPWN